MSLLEKRFAQLAISFSYFSMIPMLFVTFDAHHDGLILATVKETRRALTSGTALPFNQYGPAWSLIDTFLTWPVSQSYLLLALRVLTFCLYLLTGYFLFRIGVRTYNQRTAYIGLTIYAISQPFVSTFKSGFMSWPSAFVTPCLLALILLLERRKEEVKFQKKLFVDFYVSVVLLFLILTRAQVGILAVLLVVILYVVYFGKQNALMLLTTLLTTSFIVVAGLVQSFQSSYIFQDEFIYGVLYASSSGGFIVPKATLLGAFFWIAVFSLLEKVNSSTVIEIKFSSLFAASTIFLLFILLVYVSIIEMDLFALGSTFQRRFWISLFTAGLFVSIAKFLLLTFQYLILRRKAYFSDVLIIGFSIIGFIQVFPLFDQLHSWWGCAPLVLIISDFIVKVTGKYGHRYTKAVWVTFLGFVLLNTSLVIGSLSIVRTYLPVSDVSLISETPSVSQSFLAIGNELEQTIPEGSRVQNLCLDSNVFLLDSSFVPTSHLIVYWKNFAEAPYMRPSLKAVSNSYIVDCENNLSDDAEKFNYKQERSTLLRSFIDSNNREWKIYKYE